jgi:hypothetical protein
LDVTRKKAPWRSVDSHLTTIKEEVAKNEPGSHLATVRKEVAKNESNTEEAGLRRTREKLDPGYIPLSCCSVRRELK